MLLRAIKYIVTQEIINEETVFYLLYDNIPGLLFL